MNVLSTARYPTRAEGLAVTQVDGRLVVAVGERTLGQAPPTADRLADACVRRLRIGDGRWSIEGGDEDTFSGPLDEMPVVFGLFSELDLRSAPEFSVSVTTAVHDTRAKRSQAVAWTLAAIAIAAALLLLVVRGRPRWEAPRTVRAALTMAHPVDALVGATLACWWVLSPSFVDDGWVAAREEMFETSRGFSHYYVAFGTNLPLGYWLEWLQHWIVQSSSALVVQRIPAVACLAITWVLCRWLAARILAASVGQSNTALWALAATFLAGALAWGMTLRPEPTTALLVTTVVACMVRFLERETVGPLAAAAVLSAVAVTGHHAGVVALAPILACAGKLLDFARARPAAASTIVASTVATFLVLALVGSDLEQRRVDAQATLEFGYSTPWRSEVLRYANFQDPFIGTPLRRGSVALIALAVLSLALWRRRGRHRLLDYPATALVIGLALFVATPSKHTWHFGALTGVAAVAVACETARLRQRAARARRTEAHSILVAGAVAMVIAWTWAPRHHWGRDDLQTLDWTPAFESWIDLSTLAWALPLALLGATVLSAVARGHQHVLPGLPWRFASWSAPLLALPLLAFTIAVLAADALKTEAWTLTRQNLGALQGNAGCGLADDLSVAIPESARPLSSARRLVHRSLPDWLPATPAEGVPRFALGPARNGRSSSPWFAIGSQEFGVFVAGTPGTSDLLLEWGRLSGDRVESFEREAISISSGPELENVIPQWRLLPAEELPPPPRSAAMVRVSFRSAVAPGPAVAVTAPVSYDREPLVDRMRDANPRMLVAPDLLPYFPCARLPRLHEGVVDVPDHVVLTNYVTFLQRAGVTSPFRGVPDLYPVRRLPLSGSDADPGGVDAVLAVDTRLAGAVQAPPSRDDGDLIGEN